MKSFEQFLPAARFDAALNASSMTGHLPNRLDVRISAKSLKKTSQECETALTSHF